MGKFGLLILIFFEIDKNKSYTLLVCSDSISLCKLTTHLCLNP